MLLLCADIDECLNTTYPCDDNATCTNIDGSYNCSCNSGFTGNGTVCEGNTAHNDPYKSFTSSIGSVYIKIHIHILNIFRHILLSLQILMNVRWVHINVIVMLNVITFLEGIIASAKLASWGMALNAKVIGSVYVVQFSASLVHVSVSIPRDVCLFVFTCVHSTCNTVSNCVIYVTCLALINRC